MAVSFDPDWWWNSASTGTSLSLGVPAGGAVQVATVLVGNSRTLTDASGFTVAISGTSGGTTGVRYYHLWRPASEDTPVFGFSGSCFSLGVIGAFPAGVTTHLEPHSFIDVPGEPGRQYANPNAFVGGSSISLDHIEEWVPTDGGTVAGWLSDATDAGTEQTDLTITTPEGDIDVSAQVEVFASGVWVKLVGFALESSENPCELHINETLATASSSRRILGVLGGVASAAWAVGRIAWGARGAWS